MNFPRLMRFSLLVMMMVWPQLVVSPAKAGPLAAVGANMVFESSADGRKFESHTPLSLRGGYRFSLVDALVEYTYFRADATGTSLLSVSREHHEFLLWARKILRKDWIVSPFAGAGLGFEFERVTMTFGPEKSDEVGSPLLMMATALGVRFALNENVELQIEGRLSFASDYQPNPQFGGGAVLGVSF